MGFICRGRIADCVSPSAAARARGGLGISAKGCLPTPLRTFYEPHHANDHPAAARGSAPACRRRAAAPSGAALAQCRPQACRDGRVSGCSRLRGRVCPRGGSRARVSAARRRSAPRALAPRLRRRPACGRASCARLPPQSARTTEYYGQRRVRARREHCGHRCANAKTPACTCDPRDAGMPPATTHPVLN